MSRTPYRSTRKLLRTTFGQYRIQGILGQGGMGVVYLAQDELGRDVALKIVRESQDTIGTDVAKRFKREASISLEIVHRNIVRTFGTGAIDGTSYIATEYVRGGSLERFLAHHGLLPAPVALEVFRDLVAALVAFESAKLVHRDVKPGNIFLDLDGTAKLGDLGLARSTNVRKTRFTRTGVIIGSPYYMSPEQIEGDKTVDVRSDLYAAGIVLYQCLAGSRPFTGATPYQVLKQHMVYPAPDVREAAPETPAAVAELIANLLAKDRDQRAASAAEVHGKTEALLASLTGARERGPDASLGSATSNTVVVPVALLLAELPPVRPSPLIEPERAVTDGLGRARLTFQLPSGAQYRLFVYAGERLAMGRAALGSNVSDACLRVRPAAQNEQANLRISRTHLGVGYPEGVAALTHLGGAGGTWIEQTALAPNVPTRLPPCAIVSVAKVLKLTVRTLPAPPPANAHAEKTSTLPAVVLERLGNEPESAYALVPGRMSLASPGGRGLVWGTPGDTQLLAIDGKLWLAGGGLAPETAVPLLDGLTFSVEGMIVTVNTVKPEDQE